MKLLSKQKKTLAYFHHLAITHKLMALQLSLQSGLFPELRTNINNPPLDSHCHLTFRMSQLSLLFLPLWAQTCFHPPCPLSVISTLSPRIQSPSDTLICYKLVDPLPQSLLKLSSSLPSPDPVP